MYQVYTPTIINARAINTRVTTVGANTIHIGMEAPNNTFARCMIKLKPIATKSAMFTSSFLTFSSIL